MTSRRVFISVEEEIGTIAPEIYGHFAEQIGGVVYDGIWVGKDSDIQNVNGFRKDVIEKFRAINPPVIRWPGGCFAETYDWRDGIGKNRPTRPSWWTFMDGRYENNEFGTHEFIEFCELVGAKPYIALNITSMTPLDARNWMDYCLSPRGSTTLAREREKNGHPEPFDIPYWGIGNENWGGGGKMTAEQYALIYRIYAKTLSMFEKQVKFVANACSPHTFDWAKTFFDNIKDTRWDLPLSAVSLHHYCSGGDALNFDKDDYDALLKSARKMEDLIERHKAILVANGRDDDLKIYVDEWGCMHPTGTEVSEEKYLYQQQSTMRDAVIAAYNLNLFNNCCNYVEMANIAQVSNCLHSLFLVNKEKFVVTPTYYIFDMFKSHQGAKCLKAVVGDSNISVSASRKDGEINITIVNLSWDEDMEINIDFFSSEKNIELQEKVLLANKDIHAHNTFEIPDAVKPEREENPNCKIYLPKASVMALHYKLSKN